MKMSGKFLFAESLRYERDTASFDLFRALFLIISLMVLPSLLLICLQNKTSALVYSSIFALAACVSDTASLGIRKLSRHDCLAVVKTWVFLCITSSCALILWKSLLDFYEISYVEQQSVAEMIQGSCVFPDMILLFFAVCIITPLVEEVLFRRIIYSWWHICHAPTAFVGTALLFSLSHFFLLGIPGLFIMGICFQYICLDRKNLAASILLHGIVNSAAFVINL